ncbi:MAG: hypothetical protein WAM11_10570, partial [Cyanobium sp.]
MNPTLSTRLRDWRQDPYWRMHPPAPWPVPQEPATALLHQAPSAAAPAPQDLAQVPPGCSLLLDSADGEIPAMQLPPAQTRAVVARAAKVPAGAEPLAVGLLLPQPRDGGGPVERPVAAALERSTPDSQLRQEVALLIEALVILLEGWLALQGLAR